MVETQPKPGSPEVERDSDAHLLDLPLVALVATEGKQTESSKPSEHQQVVERQAQVRQALESSKQLSGLIKPRIVAELPPLLNREPFSQEQADQVIEQIMTIITDKLGYSPREGDHYFDLVEKIVHNVAEAIRSPNPQLASELLKQLSVKFLNRPHGHVVRR